MEQFQMTVQKPQDATENSYRIRCALFFPFIFFFQLDNQMFWRMALFIIAINYLIIVSYPFLKFWYVKHIIGTPKLYFCMLNSFFKEYYLYIVELNDWSSRVCHNFVSLGCYYVFLSVNCETIVLYTIHLSKDTLHHS